MLEFDRFGLIMTTNIIPRVGVEFDSIDEVWKFWLYYGKAIGFGVRKQNQCNITLIIYLYSFFELHRTNKISGT